MNRRPFNQLSGFSRDTRAALCLLVFTLAIAGAAARAETFADHNCTLEVPADWIDAGTLPTHMVKNAHSPDETKTVILVASVLPAAEVNVGIGEALMGVKESIARKGWPIDPEKSLVINGVPFRYITIHPSATNTMGSYAGIAGRELYLLEIVSRTGEAAADPDLQAFLQSFHLIKQVEIPADRGSSTDRAHNEGYRQGYILGRLMFTIGIPLGVVAAIVSFISWRTYREKPATRPSPPPVWNPPPVSRSSAPPVPPGEDPPAEN